MLAWLGGAAKQKQKTKKKGTRGGGKTDGSGGVELLMSPRTAAPQHVTANPRWQRKPAQQVPGSGSAGEVLQHPCGSSCSSASIDVAMLGSGIPAVSEGAPARGAPTASALSHHSDAASVAAVAAAAPEARTVPAVARSAAALLKPALPQSLDLRMIEG